MNPSNPSEGIVTLRLTISADIDDWAAVHGVSRQEAHRELMERVQGSTRAVLAAIMEGLEDLKIRTVEVSHH
jgi:hypothetical protein